MLCYSDKLETPDKALENMEEACVNTIKKEIEQDDLITSDDKYISNLRKYVKIETEYLDIETSCYNSECTPAKKRRIGNEPEFSVDDPKSINCTESKTLRTYVQFNVQTKEYNTVNYYQCPECSYNHKSYAVLQNHFRNHLLTDGIKCSYCTFNSIDETEIKTHEILIHEKEKPVLKCKICSYVISERRSLVRHMMNEHNISASSNQIVPSTVDIHFGWIKQEPVSPVNEIGEVENVDGVEYSHLNEGAITFDVPANTLSNPYLICDNTGKRTFRCTAEGCPFKTNTLLASKRHRSHHRKKWPLKCLYCTFCCKGQKLLTAHLLEHVDAQINPSEPNVVKTGHTRKRKKRFKFTYATFRCKSKTNILKRYRFYTQRKELQKCPYCSYKCRTPRKIKLHLQRHRKENTSNPENSDEDLVNHSTGGRDIDNCNSPEDADSEDDIIAVVLKDEYFNKYNQDVIKYLGWDNQATVNRLKSQFTDSNGESTESTDSIKAVILKDSYLDRQKQIYNDKYETLKSCAENQHQQNQNCDNDRQVKETENNPFITITIRTAQNANNDFLKLALLEEIAKSFTSYNESNKLENINVNNDKQSSNDKVFSDEKIEDNGMAKSSNERKEINDNPSKSHVLELFNFFDEVDEDFNVGTENKSGAYINDKVETMSGDLNVFNSPEDDVDLSLNDSNLSKIANEDNDKVIYENEPNMLVNVLVEKNSPDSSKGHVIADSAYVLDHLRLNDAAANCNSENLQSKLDHLHIEQSEPCKSIISEEIKKFPDQNKENELDNELLQCDNSCKKDENTSLNNSNNKNVVKTPPILLCLMDHSYAKAPTDTFNEGSLRNRSKSSGSEDLVLIEGLEVVCGNDSIKNDDLCNLSSDVGFLTDVEDRSTLGTQAQQLIEEAPIATQLQEELQQQELLPKDREFSCPHCKFISPNEALFKAHIKRHSYVDPICPPHCSFCSYRGIKTQVLKHTLCHVIYTEGTFRCLLCTAGFRTKESLYDHMKVEHSKNMFREHDGVCKKVYCKR